MTVAGVPAALFNNPAAAATQSSNYLISTLEGGASDAPVSVALWVYTDLAFDATVVGLLAVVSGASQLVEVQLDVLATGQLRIRVAMSNVTLTSEVGVVEANTWAHVGLTADAASAITMFVDGEAVARGVGARVRGPGSLVIGGSGDGARGFSGYVSDLRVYARTLDSIEMRSVAQREAQTASWSAAAPQCQSACSAKVAISHVAFL